MNDRIRNLLDQMSALEEDLSVALHEQEANAIFQIKGKRVEFEQGLLKAHRKLQIGLFRWLIRDRPQNLMMISGVLLFGPNIGWRNVAGGAKLRQDLQNVGLAQVPVY